MNIEEIKNIARETMLETMKNNLDSSMIFTYVSALETKINKTIEALKDTSVDMPSTLLIETIDYARHVLGDKEWVKKIFKHYY